MLQSISKLGKALNQKEQKTITGGYIPCENDAECGAGCYCSSTGCRAN